MVGKIPFEQYPRLSLLKSINIANQVQDMIFQIPNILNKHHLFFQGPEAQVLLHIVANDIAHDIKGA